MDIEFESLDLKERLYKNLLVPLQFTEKNTIFVGCFTKNENCKYVIAPRLDVNRRAYKDWFESLEGIFKKLRNETEVMFVVSDEIRETVYPLWLKAGMLFHKQNVTIRSNYIEHYYSPFRFDSVFVNRDFKKDRLHVSFSDKDTSLWRPDSRFPKKEANTLRSAILLAMENNVKTVLFRFHLETQYSVFSVGAILGSIPKIETIEIKVYDSRLNEYI